MKKLITITAAAVLLATTAGATGWNSGGKTYNQGGKGGNAEQAQSQAQGQVQGQAQGQVAYGGSGAASSSSSSGGGAANNAGNSQNLNINSNYDEAAYAPLALPGECGFGASAGVPGAVAGISIPGKHCRVLQEMMLIEQYWGRDAAAQHLYSNNARVRRTVQATTQQPRRSRNRVARTSTTRAEDR